MGRLFHALIDLSTLRGNGITMFWAWSPSVAFWQRWSANEKNILLSTPLSLFRGCRLFELGRTRYTKQGVWTPVTIVWWIAIYFLYYSYSHISGWYPDVRHASSGGTVLPRSNLGDESNLWTDVDTYAVKENQAVDYCGVQLPRVSWLRDAFFQLKCPNMAEFDLTCSMINLLKSWVKGRLVHPASVC